MDNAEKEHKRYAEIVKLKAFQCFVAKLGQMQIKNSLFVFLI